MLESFKKMIKNVNNYDDFKENLDLLIKIVNINRELIPIVMSFFVF